MMSGKEIHNFLRKRPNSARRLLRIDGVNNITAKYNLDLVKCAISLLSKEDIKIIMMNAEECETMIFCSSQGKIDKITQEEFVDGYNAIMELAGSDFPVHDSSPDFESHERGLGP